MAKPQLHLSGDPAADKLLSSNPFALLVGMVLDQQVPLEWAFAGPKVLKERLGGKLDAKTVVATDEGDLVAAFCDKPALHRYPAAMARRVLELSRLIVSEYGGDASKIWTTTTSGAELLSRVKRLPGFGEQKSKIFVALLGKQLGVRPQGWEKVSAPYSDLGAKRSVADIDGPESLVLVRDNKRALKEASKRAAAGAAP